MARPLVVTAVILPGLPKVRVMLTQPAGPGTDYHVTTNMGDELQHAVYGPHQYFLALAHHQETVRGYLNPDC